jgi:hypothetical protein
MNTDSQNDSVFIKKLTNKLINRLYQEGIFDEDIKKGEISDLMVEKLVKLFVELIQREKNTFYLKPSRHQTTEDAIKAGKYDKVNEFINSQNFPLRFQTAKKRKIEFLEFNFDPTSDQVISEAHRRGLKRPCYEDALDFGEQYPDIQRDHPIAFLHVPWQDQYGGLAVMVLYGDNKERGIGLNYFHIRWFQSYLFAFLK